MCSCSPVSNIIKANLPPKYTRLHLLTNFFDVDDVPEEKKRFGKLNHSMQPPPAPLPPMLTHSLHALLTLRGRPLSSPTHVFREGSINDWDHTSQRPFSTNLPNLSFDHFLDKTNFLFPIFCEFLVNTGGPGRISHRNCCLEI